MFQYVQDKHEIKTGRLFHEVAEEYTLPLIPIDGGVPFPGILLNFEVDDATAAMASAAVKHHNSRIFLVCKLQSPGLIKGAMFPFYTVGSVGRIKQLLHSPNGKMHLIAEAELRAAVRVFRRTEVGVEVDVTARTVTIPDSLTLEARAVSRGLAHIFEEIADLLPTDASAQLSRIRRMQEPGPLSDLVAATSIPDPETRQELLEEFDPIERAERLIELLQVEGEILELETDIRERVTARMNRNQHEYYLREQIKVIQEELGEGGETEEFAERIEKAGLPEEVKEKLTKENDRLAKVPYGSAEATVLANYLDICLDIPWSSFSKDSTQFTRVQKILDADHYGLEKVKERIVEYIAAKQNNPELRNQILCLVGPPGVGKTSIAASIARAMNRKYVRLSLGGVRDEADIRGHRKTYIGAMPGRIVTALSQAKVANPMILLDEIDKLTRDSHGDPTSALLEVLDGEQNKAFRDHFVELPIDLSHCMFLATANTLDSIPRPLRDRMEIIELGSYTKREKLEIAKRYLVPKQLARHGIEKKTLKFSDAALVELIDYYTREAGVRNLERAIASVCRKICRRLLSEEVKVIRLQPADLQALLGARKLLPETISEEDEIGVVNGMAYTELGGTLLPVEVAVLEGSGKIETTGSLGEVMKESAKLAVSYVRSIAAEWEIPTDFYKTKDIHIHFPEGAVPKDGPSAGVTMVTALVSALTRRPVRREIAMTGEISLRGRVLAIGGLKEKTMAAYSAGVKTVLIPIDNARDPEEIDPLVRENTEILPCRRISEVLHAAILPACAAPTPVSRAAEPMQSIYPTAPHPAATRIRMDGSES